MRTLPYIFLISCFAVVAQRTKQDIHSEWSQFESVKDYRSGLELNLIDNRNIQKGKLPIQSLFNSLSNNELFSPRELEVELPSNYKSRIVDIIIEYYNLLPSSSDKVILKGICDVKLVGGELSRLNTSFRVNAEIFTDIPLSKISKDRYKEKFNDYEIELSKRLREKIVERIKSELEHEEFNIIQAKSIGVAIYDKNDPESSKRKAIYDALLRGAEKAFGLEITNTSEIIDYGEITDRFLSESGGRILKYKEHPSFREITSDGYIIVTVTSLITNQSLNEKN